MLRVARPVDLNTQLGVRPDPPLLGSDSTAPNDQTHIEVLPPAYPIAVSNLSAAPAYSAQPGPTERILLRTDFAGPSDLSGLSADPRSLPDVYQNKSTRLILDLGRRVWPSRCPVYGANALVIGKVIVKKADHAVNIYVTLKGICTTTLIERGMPVAQFQTTLTHQTLKLWSNDSSDLLQPSYEFSFPLPTYSQGRMDPLPPSSYHSALMRGFVEVKYYVKADMARTRFHRHDSVLIDIHYLPRSYRPPIGPESELSDGGYWKTVKLPPIMQSDRGSVVLSRAALRMSVEFSLPKRQVYAACTPIPFLISLQASSPALVLLPQITVQLVKRWVIAASPLSAPLARETVLGSGEFWDVKEEEQGAEWFKLVSGCVAGGRRGVEVSWSVEGAFKVEYLVRVHIKPPDDMRFLGGFLPTFFYQETVRMATHEYTEDEHERDYPLLALAPR